MKLVSVALSGVSLIAFLGALSGPCGAVGKREHTTCGAIKIQKVSEEMTPHGLKQTQITFEENAAPPAAQTSDKTSNPHAVFTQSWTVLEIFKYIPTSQDRNIARLVSHKWRERMAVHEAQEVTLRIHKRDLKIPFVDKKGKVAYYNWYWNRFAGLRVVGDDLVWHPKINQYTLKSDVDETDVLPLSFGTVKSLETILSTPQALKIVMDKANGQTQLFLEVRHMVTPKTLKQWKPIDDISFLHRFGLKVESVDIAMALLPRWYAGLQKRRQENRWANQPPPSLQVILFIDEFLKPLRNQTQHADTFKTFDELVKSFGSHLHVYSQDDIAPGYEGPKKLLVDGNSHTPALFGVGTEGEGFRTPLGGISVSAFPRALPLLVNPIDPAKLTSTLFDNECRLHKISQTLPSDFDDTQHLLESYPAFKTMSEKDRLEAQLLLFDQPLQEHRALLDKASEFLQNNPLQEIDMIVDHASLPLRTLGLFAKIDPPLWDRILGQAGRLFIPQVTVVHRLALVEELARYPAPNTLLVDDLTKILEEGMSIGAWNQVGRLFGSPLTPHSFNKLTPSSYGRFLLDSCELLKRLPQESRREKAKSLMLPLYTYHKRDGGYLGRLREDWMRNLIDTGQGPQL